MKNYILLFMILFFLPVHLLAQPRNQLMGKIYESDVGHVICYHKDSLYKKGDYRNSLQKSLQTTDALSIPECCFKIAANYVKLNDFDSAFYYLFKFIEVSKDDRFLLIDQDLEVLKGEKDKWHELVRKIEEKYLQVLPPTVNQNLSIQLFHLGIRDQQCRLLLPMWGQIDTSDGKLCLQIEKENQLELEKIIKEHGFPTISMVGKLANCNAFFILQHRDEIKSKYYRMVKQIYKQGDFPAVYFAMFTDRYLLHKNKKQIYGTQLIQNNKTKKIYQGKYILWPVKNFKKINERREQMGFSQTVEEYIASWESDQYIIPAKYYRIKK